MRQLVKKIVVIGLLAVATSSAVCANEIKRPVIDGNPAGVFETISCDEARKLLMSRGFVELRDRDCTGIQYKFEGKRQNVAHVIVFSSESGGWVVLPR